MHILQTGSPKSGNSWLYQILQQIIKEAKIPYQSVVRNDPIYPLAQSWELSFEGQAGVDIVEIKGNQASYKIGKIYRMPIDDIDAYVSQNTHVWSHAAWTGQAETLFSKFDKIVYIVRDPRDRLISLSHFVFSDYRRTFSSGRVAKYKNSDIFLQESLEHAMEGWRNHVSCLLQQYHQHDVHVLFYERLLADFPRELDNLLAYLGINLNVEAKERIAKAVAFDTMKANSRSHLRKGQSYKWMEQLSAEHQARTLALVGDLIRILGYPETKTDNPPLPSLNAVNPQSVAALASKSKPTHKRFLKRLMRMLD